MTFLRYFGTNTTWYLHSHLTWAKLCHSFIIYLLSEALGAFLRRLFTAATAEPFLVAPAKPVVYFNFN
jgi:hypothetical protein